MKKLNELIDCEYDVEITGIKTNSNEVEEGNLFICTDRGTLDRHQFIDDAIKRGASAIIVKKDVGEKSVPVVKVDEPNDVLSSVMSNFYDHPDKKMTMIGITGTDGKTSTATIIQTLLGLDKCGYIGTNGYSCSKFNKDTPNTTPDADRLFVYFDEFVKAGCDYCSMEVCSEALMRGRTKGILYDISVLTNITSEHLNIHGSLENYVNDKCKLFAQTNKDGYCILNSDDEHIEEAKRSANGKILTYGKEEYNDLTWKNLKLYPDKTLYTVIYKGNEYEINSPFPGLFNVYNLSAAMLVLLALGYEMKDIIKRIPLIKVSGRLENIDEGQNFYVMVDYAHTPNGITKLLEYVKLLPINRSIVVIGQAGERDPYKRKDVGYIVSTGCDRAIFTYEDPRSEDPKDIINDMIERIKDRDNYEIIIDRHEAIKHAIEIAEEGDMVLILGKGNEAYQKLKDKTIYFNDIEEARNALKGLKEKV